MTASKEAIINTTKMTPQQKSAVTDDAAKKIIAAEANARDKKTLKLKQLRLEQAALAVPEETPEPKKKKAKRSV
jgi:hypothetical protein